MPWCDTCNQKKVQGRALRDSWGEEVLWECRECLGEGLYVSLGGDEEAVEILSRNPSQAPFLPSWGSRWSSYEELELAAYNPLTIEHWDHRCVHFRFENLKLLNLAFEVISNHASEFTFAVACQWAETLGGVRDERPSEVA